MAGFLNRWAVALRIARRSALRSRGRSLLIIALVGLPIAGLSTGTVLLASSHPTDAELVQNTLGHAEAKLTVVASPADGVTQNVRGEFTLTSSGSSSNAAMVDPRTVVSTSTRLLRLGNGAGTFRTPSGATSLQVETGPAWDPALNGGPFELDAGRLPRTPDEVLVSTAGLKRLGTSIGGTITMLQPHHRALTVVGALRDRSQSSTQQIVFTAESVLSASDLSPDRYTYYLPSTPVNWSMVQRFNRAGATVFSREVVLHPPRAALAAQSISNDSLSLNAGYLLAAVLGMTFAVLEVALLGGSAFLVTARQQQRMLATIASVGAERGLLARVVTASGVVLGAAGSGIGVLAGIGIAVLVMRFTEDGTRYPGLHLLWPVLLGIALFGIVVGWFAALVPARAASRFDVMAALRGARTPQKVGKRPAVGLVLLAAGVAATLLGGIALLAALKVGPPTETVAQLGALLLIGGGSVLAQIGVVLCAGLLLRGVARLLGGAPLSVRLAARDTSRNLGRAVPAVASLMTTVFVASFVMCVANTASINSAKTHYWAAPVAGEALSQILTSGQNSPTAGLAARWLATIRQQLPVDRAELLSQGYQGTADTTSDKTKDAVPYIAFPDLPGTCDERSRLDIGNLACGPFTAMGGSANNAQQALTVGDPVALALLLGHAPSAGDLDVLARGGAVALRSDLAPSGVSTVNWYTPKQLSSINGDFSAAHPRKVDHLPTVVDLPDHPQQDALFISPTTARALGVSTIPDRVLMHFSRTPTNAQIDASSQALGAIANVPGIVSINIESGPQDFGSLIAWYVLLACLLIAISAGATAIGLARTDGRADDITLASLGAPTRLRRSVALVQAIIICGVGAIIGTVLGQLPAVALSLASSNYQFAPPMAQLLLAAIGIPLLIGVGSWVLVGNRGDLSRRNAIA